MVLYGLANNNQRAGAIIDITMQEFNNRKVNGDDEVMMVRSHKTFKWYDHARIVMRKTIGQMLQAC